MKKLFFLAIISFILVILVSCSKQGDLTISRAMRAYQNQNYDEALSLFKESLNEETNYSAELIYNFISSIYLQQEDLENAVIYQEKSCEIRGEYRNLVSLGMTYHLLGRDEESEITYKKAIELNPKKGEAYASLGALYLGQEKPSEAIENLKKASEIEPKIAIVHANLALAYAMNGENQNSEREFEIAEELKCENLNEFKERAAALQK